MDQLATSLGPIFAAGFAVQQLLEILTPILALDERAGFQKYKKVIVGIVSLVAGLVLASLVPSFMVLRALKLDIPTPLDIAISGLVLSAGTEGINSILKFMKYAKEDKKATAATKETPKKDGDGGAPPAGIERLNRA